MKIVTFLFGLGLGTFLFFGIGCRPIDIHFPDSYVGNNVKYTYSQQNIDGKAYYEVREIINAGDTVMRASDSTLKGGAFTKNIAQSLKYGANYLLSIKKGGCADTTTAVHQFMRKPLDVFDIFIRPDSIILPDSGIKLPNSITVSISGFIDSLRTEGTNQSGILNDVTVSLSVAGTNIAGGGADPNIINPSIGKADPSGNNYADSFQINQLNTYQVHFAERKTGWYDDAQKSLLIKDINERVYTSNDTLRLSTIYGQVQSPLLREGDTVVLSDNNKKYDTTFLHIIDATSGIGEYLFYKKDANLPITTDSTTYFASVNGYVPTSAENSAHFTFKTQTGVSTIVDGTATGKTGTPDDVRNNPVKDPPQSVSQLITITATGTIRIERGFNGVLYHVALNKKDDAGKVTTLVTAPYPANGSTDFIYTLTAPTLIDPTVGYFISVTNDLIGYDNDDNFAIGGQTVNQLHPSVFGLGETAPQMNLDIKTLNPSTFAIALSSPLQTASCRFDPPNGNTGTGLLFNTSSVFVDNTSSNKGVLIPTSSLHTPSVPLITTRPNSYSFRMIDVDGTAPIVGSLFGTSSITPYNLWIIGFGLTIPAPPTRIGVPLPNPLPAASFRGANPILQDTLGKTYLVAGQSYRTSLGYDPMFMGQVVAYTNTGGAVYAATQWARNSATTVTVPSESSSVGARCLNDGIYVLGTPALDTTNSCIVLSNGISLPVPVIVTPANYDTWLDDIIFSPLGIDVPANGGVPGDGIFNLYKGAPMGARGNYGGDYTYAVNANYLANGTNTALPSDDHFIYILRADANPNNLVANRTITLRNLTTNFAITNLSVTNSTNTNSILGEISPLPVSIDPQTSQLYTITMNLIAPLGWGNWQADGVSGHYYTLIIEYDCNNQHYAMPLRIYINMN